MTFRISTTQARIPISEAFSLRGFSSGASNWRNFAMTNRMKLIRNAATFVVLGWEACSKKPLLLLSGEKSYLLEHHFCGDQKHHFCGPLVGRITLKRNFLWVIRNATFVILWWAALL